MKSIIDVLNESVTTHKIKTKSESDADDIALLIRKNHKFPAVVTGGPEVTVTCTKNQFDELLPDVSDTFTINESLLSDSDQKKRLNITFDDIEGQLNESVKTADAIASFKILPELGFKGDLSRGYTKVVGMITISAYIQHNTPVIEFSDKQNGFILDTPEQVANFIGSLKKLMEIINGKPSSKVIPDIIRLLPYGVSDSW